MAGQSLKSGAGRHLIALWQPEDTRATRLQAVPNRQDLESGAQGP